MNIINFKKIYIRRHPVNGILLSFWLNNETYIKKQYIGYSVGEARKQFKKLIKKFSKYI